MLSENTSLSGIPDERGTNYLNYKGFHSMVLLDPVVTHCKFIWFDIAAPGPYSDSHILFYSDLRHKMEDNTS